MASPLVYFFAGVACLLALWFVLAGLLALRHALERGKQAPTLKTFSETNGTRMPAARVTIGDLVRDEQLLKAARDGAAARRQSLKPGP